METTWVLIGFQLVCLVFHVTTREKVFFFANIGLMFVVIYRVLA